MTGSDRDELGAAPGGGRAGRGAGATDDPAAVGSGAVGSGAAADEPDVHRGAGSPVAPLVAGVVMICFGVLMLTQTLAIRGEGFDLEGPRFMPFAVTLLWIALSVAYLGQQVLRLARSQGSLPAERFAHTGRVVALLVLLVAYAYAIDPIGYVISTAVLFFGAARVLGSHVIARDITVAVGLSVGVYLVFTRLLGVYLPQGVLAL